MKKINDIIRKALQNSPLRHLYYYRYQYNFTPSQLCFLCERLSKTRDLGGSVLEIGVAYGATTIFLNRHMQDQGIYKKYICIDTFDGFTESDIEYEVKRRGKSEEMFSYGFKSNSVRRFHETLNFNRVKDVEVFQTDISEFDYKLLGPICFCLLDVDLYAPTFHALPHLYKKLTPGGIIVIDDCVENNRYDGAYEAYMQFCLEKSISPEVACNKLGIISKS